jgi:hypothetical protein
MGEMMRAALAKLPAMVQMYFPKEAKAALVACGEEIDRLRADVDELRSKIQPKE